MVVNVVAGTPVLVFQKLFLNTVVNIVIAAFSKYRNKCPPYCNRGGWMKKKTCIKLRVAVASLDRMFSEADVMVLIKKQK